ncbi:hypothetical protein NF556_20830 [Ornithinimicrobium faecis]|uniref:Glyoxalase-like domain-containing protein n=1 Tax=Ornithinimicrobium faecis TaxID=2934158 RepID=A0ABY4YTU7_9MICO|nr:VOC family protein [Ornithinimicrobium sp. HY1793]USQ79999.1 hypothetical protein NF556_20830 [Ornithinimicrobium sp. HY1793]
MTQNHRSLTAREFQGSAGVSDWRALGVGACAWFGATSHATGAALVRGVVEAAAGADVAMPFIELRSSGVRVRLAPDKGSFSQGDVTLAQEISRAAADLEMVSDPGVLQDVQLTFDTLDQAAVMPFWQTALGYDLVGEDDLVDPLRRHPPIWFQDQDAPRPLRNRVHLDSVAPQPRAAVALESVRADASSVKEQGYYATVADAEGNEVDLLPLPEGADLWAPSAESGGNQADLEDWRLVFAGMACYPVSSTRQAVELAEAVARLADEAGLPLGVDLRPGVVVIDTGKDVPDQDGYEQLAVHVQAAARELGLTADPSLARFIQVGIDAVDIVAVRAFWRAVLRYDEDPRDGVTDLFDPRRLNTVVFFQPMDESDMERRAQRNRIHVDIFLSDDQAQERVAAAVAAGGTVVREAATPQTWTIADPEGNEVDITFSVGREELFRDIAADSRA